MNYSTLSQQIIAYANRANSTEFKDAVPYFIEMGQQRIWQDLSAFGLQKTISGNFTLGNPFVSKPADWLETISFNYGTTASAWTNNVVLFPRSFEFCINYWPNAMLTDSDNPPLFYADDVINNTYRFLISPTPDKNYLYQLRYKTRPIFITAENQTNVLTDYYQDLLFYSCFLEALNYLGDTQQAIIYTQNYEKALNIAKKLTIDRFNDQSSIRSGE